MTTAFLLKNKKKIIEKKNYNYLLEQTAKPTGRMINMNLYLLQSQNA